MEIGGQKRSYTCFGLFQHCCPAAIPNNFLLSEAVPIRNLLSLLLRAPNLLFIAIMSAYTWEDRGPQGFTAKLNAGIYRGICFGVIAAIILIIGAVFIIISTQAEPECTFDMFTGAVHCDEGFEKYFIYPGIVFASLGGDIILTASVFPLVLLMAIVFANLE